MRQFVHLNARSVDEAVAALESYNGRARLNAGGTDLFGFLKDEFLPEYPEAIVNIKTVHGLDLIREDQGGLRIGAMTRLADLANSPLIRARYGALAEAAHSVASPQIRNVATLGGNLCQDVRCCYFRYPRHIGGPISCARKGNGPCLAVKGDNRQHAIMEGRRCFAVCPSDTAVALALYDAQLIVVGPAGERRIGIREFYTPLGNALHRNELVREIEIPAVTGPCRQAFHKFTLRKPIDFAIVSVATVVTVSDGVCSDARIAVGAVAPGIHRALAAEEFLRGRPLNEDSAAQAGELAVKGARPLSRNGYKVEIARTMVARALLGKGTGDGVPVEEVRMSQEGRFGCDIHGHGGHGDV